MDQHDYQLKWPQAELDRIGNKVQTDYRAALADHNRRMALWRQHYRRWRALVDPPFQGEESASNVPVPYVRWNVMTKWAKEMDSLFGDDAEIVAVPVGPSNFHRDKKISKYMSWRVFNSMKLTKPFCEFINRKILFGRSVAYSPWKKDTFVVPASEDSEQATQKGYLKEPNEDGGYRVTEYEGPDFDPMWPDDFIVPAEEVRSLHDFSFVIRRYRVTPEQLLQGEEEGRYQNIKKNWKTIVNLAQHGTQREFEGEEIKLEKDEAEGIMYQRPLSSGEWVMVLEWYGRWRPLKKGPRGGMPSASEWDFDKRDMHQHDFVVRFLWDLRLVIGVQDLAELYPLKKNRRPFVESSMMADGTYWSPGLPELLSDLEDELRANHNQATEASQLAMNPPLGYRPASGFDPETFKVEPGLAIPLNDPKNDLFQFQIHADMGIATWKEQCVLAYGERLTGMSDMHLGRQSDRPNAPRTGIQTQQLLEEGNVRISLDTKVLREDMSVVLAHFWDLEYMFASPNQFFRVTEEDAGGLFPVNNGGSILSLEDRDGRYDFRLQFANSVYSREAKKQQSLARYQLDLQNPLVVNNPLALWEVTRLAHEALGDPNFEDLVPKPAAPDMPIDPKTEWINLLHGDEIHVNPQDNDQLHLTRHMRDLQQAEKDQGGAAKDPDAIKQLMLHYRDHIAQLQHKKLEQALVEQAVQAASQLAQSGALQFPNGLFGNAPQLPAGNPQAKGPYPYPTTPQPDEQNRAA
jgi:hypothetical protein